MAFNAKMNEACNYFSVVVNKAAEELKFSVQFSRLSFTRFCNFKAQNLLNQKFWTVEQDFV